MFLVSLRELQQFGNFCLPFVVVRQLPKRYGKGKKGHLQVFGKIDLAKPKIVDPAIFAAIFSRAVSGPALLVARVSSSRHFLRRAPPVRDGVRSPPFPPVRDAAALGTNEGFQVAVESFLPPWTAGRHRSPRFVHCRSPIHVSCQFVV